MLSMGDRIEFVVTDKREVLIRPISKKVDKVFGILHKPGRKTVSVEEMGAKIRIEDGLKTAQSSPPLESKTQRGSCPAKASGR